MQACVEVVSFNQFLSCCARVLRIFRSSKINKVLPDNDTHIHTPYYSHTPYLPALCGRPQRSVEETYRYRLIEGGLWCLTNSVNAVMAKLHRQTDLQQIEHSIPSQWRHLLVTIVGGSTRVHQNHMAKNDVFNLELSGYSLCVGHGKNKKLSWCWQQARRV